MKSEKYTDRDILIRVADSSEQLLAHFNNGKFVESLKLGIKEQTKEIIKEIAITQETTKEMRGVQNWIFRALVPVIFGLMALLTKILYFTGN